MSGPPRPAHATALGVFDSGLGGLSVVRRLLEHLPDEPIVYFGDTARVPYGVHSPATIVRYTLEAAALLAPWRPAALVVACNTISAVALPQLRAATALPIIDMVAPAAAAAAARAHDRPIGVIGTPATVRSGAYRRAVLARRPTARVVEQAAPLLVPCVEEGRGSEDRVVRLALREYLAPLRRAGVGTVVLGCTHFPMLAAAIQREMGPEVSLVDCGAEAARACASLLRERRERRLPAAPAAPRLLVSEDPVRARRLAERWLGRRDLRVEIAVPEPLAPAADRAPLTA